MKLDEVCMILGAVPLHEAYDPNTEITGGYAGDLLSHVMSRLSEGDAWLTVMSNINTVAVAVLSDAACIILCESAPFDEDALTRAEKQKMPVFRTACTMFEASMKVGAKLMFS